MDLIRRLLEQAGFDEIEISIVKLPCQSRSAAEFAIGLVRGNPVAAAIEERGESVDRVVQAVAERIGEQFGVAPVETTMQALVCRALR